MPATASLTPWFTHPRMAPKWIGLGLTAGAAAATWGHGSAWAFAAGWLWFFPNEYGIHRFVYHRVAVSGEVKGPARSHSLHHLEPHRLRYIFNDPKFSVTVGGVYLAIVWAITRNVTWATAFSAGNFVALAYYEYVHFIAHRPGVVPWLPGGKRLKKMHIWHHYKSEHWWFGVTTKWMDQALGTYADAAKVDRSPTVRTLVPPEAVD